MLSYLENAGISCVCESFISCKALPFKLPEQQFTWVFFTSKNGVKSFFENVNTLPKGIKYGAIALETAGVLAQFVVQVDFVGKHHDTATSAAEFAASLSVSDLVLIPQGDIANRTLQKALPSNKYSELTVYETIDRIVHLEEMPDLVFFTSPSNVRSFYKQYPLRLNTKQKQLAIGLSTERELKKLGLSPAVVSNYQQSNYGKLISELLS